MSSLDKEILYFLKPMCYTVTQRADSFSIKPMFYPVTQRADFFPPQTYVLNSVLILFSSNLCVTQLHSVLILFSSNLCVTQLHSVLILFFLKPMFYPVTQRADFFFPQTYVLHSVLILFYFILALVN